ncbi:MAG TPA: hypothetical protein VF041_13960 [Gemmatimonadaceae bacterium]
MEPYPYTAESAARALVGLARLAAALIPRRRGSVRSRLDARRDGAMIARMWRGVTPASKAEAYLDYLSLTGLADYRDTPGNAGVWVLRRDTTEGTEFLLVSLWDSYESIQRFAGPEYERAVYYPEDDAYLLEREPEVRHFEVVLPEEIEAPEVRRAG